MGDGKDVAKSLQDSLSLTPASLQNLSMGLAQGFFADFCWLCLLPAKVEYFVCHLLFNEIPCSKLDF